MVASVLSKKIAAGSTHVLIDIPVGRTAKVRSQEAANSISARLIAVAKALGIIVKPIITDGSQPIGRGIGPALEAMDVLSVLQNAPTAPDDLRCRSLLIASQVLEMAGKAAAGEGMALARATLASGEAWRKFQAICEAQGGMRKPPTSKHSYELLAKHTGKVLAIDNRLLGSIAKLAGAPTAPAAGVVFRKALGSFVEVGEPFLTIHAESEGELAYARAFAQAQENIISIVET
jgi:thymidine phosphorylase